MIDSRDSAHAYRGRGRGGKKEAAGKDVEVNGKLIEKNGAAPHRHVNSTYSPSLFDHASVSWAADTQAPSASL
eukprot:9492674-Pyramimonas_sp.AAC.1